MFPAFSNILFKHFSQPQTSAASGLAQQGGDLRVESPCPRSVREETETYFTTGFH